MIRYIIGIFLIHKFDIARSFFKEYNLLFFLYLLLYRRPNPFKYLPALQAVPLLSVSLRFFFVVFGDLFFVFISASGLHLFLLVFPLHSLCAFSLSCFRLCIIVQPIFIWNCRNIHNILSVKTKQLQSKIYSIIIY